MSQELAYGFALDYWAKRQHEKIAVQTDHCSISYGALHETSSRLAAALQAHGAQAGDPVLIFMPNCIEFPIVFYAAAKLGLNIVPANALYKIVEIRQLIHQIHPKLAFVCSDDTAELVRTADRDIPIIYASLNNTSFQHLLDTKAHISAFPADLTTPCVYVSTSGSTGKLKFVSRSYLSQIVPAKLYLQALHATQDDILLSYLPMSQQFGMAALLCACIAGCTAVLLSHFHPGDALSVIEQNRVTIQYGVPTMFMEEIEAFNTMDHKPDISSLRTGIVAGAAGVRDVFQWFDQQIGCRLLNCYGATEVAGITMTDLDDPASIRYSTCGRALPNTSIEILDDTGRSLPPGCPGEVVCTTPWVMREYVGEVSLTNQVLDSQRRFLTGDIGTLDHEGHLTICGRKKDIIIRGGYNIFPAEVELALLRCTGISEACVMGYRDKILGERICAFVKMKSGAEKSEENIRSQLENDIAKYKLPDQIVFLKEIPKLAGGKNDCAKLAEILQTLP